MKKLLAFICFALLSEGAMAFESGQLSLDTPNILKSSEGSFGIRHRFYGKGDDLNKFFGTDDGGNMHFMLKYALLDNLVLGVDHTKDKSAYGVGVEYSHHFKWMSIAARLKQFRIEVGFEKYHTSSMANVALQTANFFEHINFTANVGYDAYYEHQILGFGVDLNANNFIPYFTFTEKLSLLAEYYPQVDEIDGVSGKYDSFAVGIKYQTYGHHFELLATNSTHMDARNMSLGTNSDDLHFGFNINRKF